MSKRFPVPRVVDAWAFELFRLFSLLHRIHVERIYCLLTVVLIHRILMRDRTSILFPVLVYLSGKMVIEVLIVVLD